MENLLSGTIGIGVVLFLLILAILWFLLPFAIFGTKDKLSLLITETQKTNQELAALRQEVAQMAQNNESVIPSFKAD